MLLVAQPNIKKNTKWIPKYDLFSLRKCQLCSWRALWPFLQVCTFRSFAASRKTFVAFGVAADKQQRQDNCTPRHSRKCQPNVEYGLRGYSALTTNRAIKSRFLNDCWLLSLFLTFSSHWTNFPLRCFDTHLCLQDKVNLFLLSVTLKCFVHWQKNVRKKTFIFNWDSVKWAALTHSMHLNVEHLFP